MEAEFYFAVGGDWLGWGLDVADASGHGVADAVVLAALGGLCGFGFVEQDADAHPVSALVVRGWVMPVSSKRNRLP